VQPPARLERQRITTPFGPVSTAAEVAAETSLLGKNVILTGPTSNMGIEIARALAATGADITLAVRNTASGYRVAMDVATRTGNPNVCVSALDLANRASIDAFVRGWNRPLHVLINNAKVMFSRESRTPEGWETHFAVNHLGHFALATGLCLAMADAGTARILSVSSSAHLLSPVVHDDIHFRRRPYDPLLAYAQSKTANAPFAVAASAGAELVSPQTRSTPERS
jgi:NAD(P)-dependent dehydrogenase (short-subunit alcohol dehydrogenase family)